MTIAPRAGSFRRQLVVLSALTVLTACSQWSCYELEFRTTIPNSSWFVRVDLTSEDEQRHPAFAWIGSEVAKGKTSGSRRGRWLVDDLWALSRERGVDPSGVRKPLFVVHGTAVLVTPLNHCLVF